MNRLEYTKGEELKVQNQNIQHFDKIPLYYDQINESQQIAQIYQNFKQNHFDVNKLPKGFDYDQVKQYQQDIRNGNSTPATPSYIAFGSDYIKSTQIQGIHQKPEKHLIQTLDEYSPIQRLEDSRVDMTAHMFDLSMIQSRDNFHSQANQNQNGQYKSTFSNFVNQANQHHNGVKSNIASPYSSQSNIPQVTTAKIGNPKNENKSQKLRERLEKYSHQMLNNINPQKGIIDNQQKIQAKGQSVTSKTLNNVAVDNKRIQAIKNSTKNSKVSTPVSTSKNAQGELKIGDLELNEQNREKSQNNLTKTTFSSSKKTDQPKTERNTPISKQAAHKGNQDQQKQKNKQQTQIKKNSQDLMITNNGSQNQNKFILVSPEKNKTVSYNQHFNYNNNKKPSQFNKNDDDNDNDNYQQQQSISPSKIVDYKNYNGEQNKYGLNHNRKYSDFMNDRISKKSLSQENINFTRTNSVGSSQSLSKRSSIRKLYQNYESQHHQNQRYEKQNAQLQNSENNYFSQIIKTPNNKSKQLFNQQIDECNLTNEEQKDDDAFSINIYKNQFQQNIGLQSDIFQKANDEEDDKNEIPQTQGINRSQSSHTTAKDEINQEKNSSGKNSGIKRSHTSMNMIQNGDNNIDTPNEKHNIKLDNVSDNNNQQIKIEFKNNEKIFNLHGNNNENNHNNLTSYKVKNQDNKTSPNNIKNNQRNSNQNLKTSPSTKETEVQEHQEQRIQEFDSKNKDEHNQQKLSEMKIYNLNQRKNDLLQVSKNSPSADNTTKGQSKAQQSNFTTSSNTQINLGKYHSSNIHNNYYNSHEKQIQSKRITDQVEANKKTDSSQNKSNINANNSSSPICLYNLTKDNINTHRNSNKNNNSNTIQTHTPQHNNYFNTNDNIISPSKKINGKEQQDSPSKINTNINSIGAINNQKQPQQIIDFSQKSKQLNKNQSIHIIQSQGSQSYYTPQQYKTVNVQPNNEQHSSNNSPSIVNAFSSNNGNHNSVFVFYPNATSSNINDIQSHSQSGYNSKEKQSGSGVKASKREQIANKEKFIRKSNDFKIPNEQDIADKCLQRKDSSNFRGSTKDTDRNKYSQAKSFQGDNSQAANNILLINTSLNDNQNGQQKTQLKTLQNVFKTGIEIQKQNSKKQTSQVNVQPKTERSSHQESQQTFKQVSQSTHMSQIQSANKNARKNSKNDASSNLDGQKYYQSQKTTDISKSQQKAQDSELLDNVNYQQPQKKQESQIQKLLGKCVNSYSNESHKLEKSQSTVLKANGQQKGQLKTAQSTINDTNVDYILKNLQQHKLTSQSIAINQSTNTTQNNKSVSSQPQQPQKKLQKTQSSKNTLNSMLPQKEQQTKNNQSKQQ